MSELLSSENIHIEGATIGHYHIVSMGYAEGRDIGALVFSRDANCLDVEWVSRSTLTLNYSKDVLNFISSNFGTEIRERVTHCINELSNSSLLKQ